MCRLRPDTTNTRRCRFRSRPVLFFLSIPLLLFSSAPVTLALSPSDLLIVYNTNMKKSKEVAAYYADKRMVPRTNLIGVDVSTSERMVRREFEKKLVPPVRRAVKRLKSREHDPAILLVYGIPLMVRGPETVKANGEESFLLLIEKKVGEYRGLVLQLNEKLDRLTGRGGSEPGKHRDRKAAAKLDEIHKDARESYVHALKYLKDSQGNRDLEETHARVSSLLIRLLGTSPAARAHVGSLLKEGKADQKLFENRELLKWNAVMRRELNNRAFLGTPPGEALDTASIWRFTDGLWGELRFWADLKETYGKNETSASVESELSLVMASSYQVAKWLPNAFHSGYDPLPFVKKVRERTVRVARLDGPTPETAKRLVDDALATEVTGLDGVFYIDARGLKNTDSIGSYAWYDGHLEKLHEALKEKSSMKVVIDRNPGVFPVGACRDAALYCGWYSLGNYVDAFDWKRGAVGFHVASVEARTLRKGTSNVWCKRMLEKGVCATLGPVREPYLHSFPLPDQFFPLLMTGKMPLLDVYYRTLPHLSWRQLIIGDPLYTPFKKRPAIRVDATGPEHSP